MIDVKGYLRKMLLQTCIYVYIYNMPGDILCILTILNSSTKSKNINPNRSAGRALATWWKEIVKEKQLNKASEHVFLGVCSMFFLFTEEKLQLHIFMKIL